VHRVEGMGLLKAFDLKPCHYGDQGATKSPLCAQFVHLHEMCTKLQSKVSKSELFDHYDHRQLDRHALSNHHFTCYQLGGVLFDACSLENRGAYFVSDLPAACIALAIDGTLGRNQSIKIVPLNLVVVHRACTVNFLSQKILFAT